MKIRSLFECCQSPKYLLVAVLFIVGILAFIIYARSDTLRSVQMESARERDHFENVQRKIVALEPLKHQLKQIDSRLDELRTLMPDDLVRATLKSELMERALQSQVVVEEVEFRSVVLEEFYLRHPVHITLSGEFAALYYFLYDHYYQTKQPVMLGDFEIRHIGPAGKVRLIIVINLFTYRPYDEE